MHIDDDHMYHGAALIQIAERPEFKAINAFKGINARGAFRINDDVAVYLKHASKPTKTYDEYLFTFNSKNLEELRLLKKQCSKVFIGLVCVQAEQICCLTLAELEQHIANRTQAFGGPEKQYLLLVTLHKGKQFRVYVNQPGKKGKAIGEQKVSRNCFPGILFA